MELVYLWVDDYKNIYKQGFNFSPSFECKYDENSNELTIEELYKNFYKDLGYSKEDVKNMVFCNYLHKDDIHKRNHSKLTQDILKQFGIRR